MTDDCWTDLIEDMKARRELGLKRYGRPVSSKLPGVDWETHLDEELLDALVYHRALRKIKAEAREKYETIMRVIKLGSDVWVDSEYGKQLVEEFLTTDVPKLLGMVAPDPPPPRCRGRCCNRPPVIDHSHVELGGEG